MTAQDLAGKRMSYYSSFFTTGTFGGKPLPLSRITKWWRYQTCLMSPLEDGLVEKLTVDDVQSECTRLETLSDRLEQTLEESRSIRELIESAAHEHHLDELRQLLQTRFGAHSAQPQPSTETCSPNGLIQRRYPERRPCCSRSREREQLAEGFSTQL